MHAPQWALFTTATKWKQPKCPPRLDMTFRLFIHLDEWIKMWYINICMYAYIHIMEYYSSIKKNEIMPFAAIWMQMGIIMLSEVSQRQIEAWGRWYAESEIWHNECTQETETDPQIQRTELWLPGLGEWDGFGVWGVVQLPSCVQLLQPHGH